MASKKRTTDAPLVQITKRPSPYGKAILDGVPQYTSASSLTKADPNSYAGCLRAWYYNKVLGFEEPETAAMRKGTRELHDPIDHYFTTGARAFPDWVQAGFHHMPARGEDIHVEREIGIPWGEPNPPRELEPDAPRIDLSRAPLRADGIALVGRIDLMHSRQFYVANGGAILAEDPTMRVVESKDWKSTSSMDYAKTGVQLRTAIQMVTYGNYAARVFPWMTHNRASHVYFLTKGAPKSWKSTTLMDRDHLARQWEYVDGIARSMRHAAAETDVEKVPGNPKSCGAYYKGCPHRSRCSIGSHNSIPSWAGVALQLGKEQPQPDEGDSPIMSLLKTLNIVAPTADASQGVAAALNLQGQVAPPTPQNPIGQLMATTPNPIGALIEQAAPVLADRVREAFALIESAQIGQPPYLGEVAKWYEIHSSTKPAPSGKLSGYTSVDSMETLFKVAADVAEYLKSLPNTAPVTPVVTTPAPIVQSAPDPLPTAVRPSGAQVDPTPAPSLTSLVPPETPASNPALAALPVEGFGTVPVAMMANPLAGSPNNATNTAAFTPPATPVPLNITTGTMIAAAADGAPPTEPTKVAGTRKKRAPKVKPEGQAASEPAEMTLYVDCTPTSDFERLQPHVNAWHKALVDYYKVDPPDIRCATREPLGFQGWKGAIAVLAREQAAKLPKGAHVIMTRDSDINKIVAEALESALDADGQPVFDNIVKGI